MPRLSLAGTAREPEGGGSGGGGAGGEPVQCQSDRQGTGVPAAAAAAAPRRSSTGQQRAGSRNSQKFRRVPRRSGASRSRLLRSSAPSAPRQPGRPRASRSLRKPRDPRKRKRRRYGTPHISSSHNFNNPPDHYDDHDIELHRQLQEGLARFHAATRAFDRYGKSVNARLQRQGDSTSAVSRLSTLCQLQREIFELDKNDGYLINDDEIHEKNLQILSKLEDVRLSGTLGSYRRTEKKVAEHKEEVDTIRKELKRIYNLIGEIQNLFD